MKKMFYSKSLAERWPSLSLDEQMGNLGADIGRAANAQSMDKRRNQISFELGLELLNLTMKDPKNQAKLSELIRLKEELMGCFLGENKRNLTSEYWNDYFYSYSVAAMAKYFNE